MRNFSPVLLCVSGLLTIGIILVSSELVNTRAQLHKMATMVNCTRAVMCYQEFTAVGRVSEGCLKVFELANPEACAELWGSAPAGMSPESGF